jgi:hypothetical protein
MGVATFGALLGHAREKIIPGLHTSALISTGLLITAAALAWLGVRKGKNPLKKFQLAQ